MAKEGDRRGAVLAALVLVVMLALAAGLVWVASQMPTADERTAEIRAETERLERENEAMEVRLREAGVDIPDREPRAASPVGQEARLQGCMARMQYWQRMGVWLHGGARPGVDERSWRALSDGQQDEIFEIAACISAAGETGPRSVTVTGEGGFGDLGTRTMPNRRTF